MSLLSISQKKVISDYTLYRYLPDESNEIIDMIDLLSEDIKRRIYIALYLGNRNASKSSGYHLYWEYGQRKSLVHCHLTMQYIGWYISLWEILKLNWENNPPPALCSIQWWEWLFNPFELEGKDEVNDAIEAYGFPIIGRVFDYSEKIKSERLNHSFMIIWKSNNWKLICFDKQWNHYNFRILDLDDIIKPYEIDIRVAYQPWWIDHKWFTSLSSLHNQPKN